MDWNKVIISLFIIGIFRLDSVVGQSFETGVNYYAGIAHSEGFEPGSNGFSLDATYLYELTENLSAHGGLELGISGWGSQVLAPLGARFGEKHQLDLELLNGLALYHQGAGYVGGFGAYYVYTFFADNRHRLTLSAGLRFSIQPSYRKYSELYYYLDLPLRIRWYIAPRG